MSNLPKKAKGAAAEVYEPHKDVSGSAGLRENMSQTVTKVESCQRSGRGSRLASFFAD